VIPPDEFRQTAFPDLAPGESPAANWYELVKGSAFNERIAPLNLRYLILIKGGKSVDVGSAEVDLVEDAIIIDKVIRYHTDLSAEIVDLITHDVIATAVVDSHADAHTGAYGGYCLVWIPYYIPSMPTFFEACEELGENAVKVFIEMQKGVPEDSLDLILWRDTSSFKCL